MKQLYALAILLICFVSHGQNESSLSLTRTNPDKGNFVWNEDALLSNKCTKSINDLLSDLFYYEGFEVAVVGISSIAPHTADNYATSLFNFWALGNHTYNDGLLVLIVKDQRRVVFRTGSGTQSVLSDEECKQIQEKLMVPKFKKGHYSKGTLKAIKVICKKLKDKSLQWA